MSLIQWVECSILSNILSDINRNRYVLDDNDSIILLGSFIIDSGVDTLRHSLVHSHIL